MKTIRTILFVAFAATTFISCQKELADNENINSNGKLVTFKASVNSTTDLKTAIRYEEGKDSFTTFLTSADGISVNGVKSESVTPNADNTAITFDVEGVTGPYYAVTSRHDKGYDPETHTYEVQFSGAGSPQKHSMTESGYPTFDMKADILAAYGESENLTFHHLTTFYAISVDNAKIKSIYVRQGDGGDIAGQWNISFEGENMLPKLTPKSLSNVIGYDCGAEGLDQGEVMLVGIPSFDYVDGLIFTLKDVNGNFASYKVPKEKTQHAADGGKIIPFKPDYNPGSGVIESVEDWEDFAAAINSGDDSKLYRWVGNGTVKLGAHISAKNLTSITTKFPYVFDGGSYSITRNNATSALFSDLTGEIRNLTLDGELNLEESEGAPFVTNMYAGAKITGCTNNMDVTFTFSTHCYVTGFAAIAVRNDTEGPELLEISNCTNNGKIEGTVNVSTANCNTAVAGFIADVRSAVGNFDYDVKLDNCKNTAPITLAPISGTSTTYGMSVCGVAGIIGWCRDIKSLTLNDCDNSGAITVKADYINSVEGLKACVAAAGGIIGVGSTVGSGKISTNGRVYSLIDCDNTATIYNCMVNSSAAADIYNKVYTGGLAGVLIGKSDQFATVKSCTNTGNVFSYDICSDDNPKPEVVSTSPALCSVVSGFIGVGGNLNLDGCTVDCQIGNGKRPVVAWGGVIGYILKPFKINNMNLKYSGYFQRLSYKTTYKYNRAVIGVPANITKVNIGTESEPEYENRALDLSGSVISGYLKAVGKLMSAGDLKTEGDKTNTENLVSTLGTPLFNSLSKVRSHLLNGGTGDNGATLIKDVDITNLTITYSAN